MADITIFKPAALTVNIVDGDPPVDQSAMVAQLTTDLATANANLATANGTIATLQAAIAKARAAAQADKDADAANVAGQGVLDALPQ